jgi:hypothetical protein
MRSAKRRWIGVDGNMHVLVHLNNTTTKCKATSPSPSGPWERSYIWKISARFWGATASSFQAHAAREMSRPWRWRQRSIGVESASDSRKNKRRHLYTYIALLVVLTGNELINQVTCSCLKQNWWNRPLYLKHSTTRCWQLTVFSNVKFQAHSSF